MSGHSQDFAEPVRSLEQPSAGTPGHYELSLTGALDLAGAPVLDAILREAIADGCRDLHLDLAGVSFLDCVGLSVLVRAHSQLFELHGRLVLREPSWSVRRLVCLAELCPLFGLDSGPYACRHNGAGSALDAGCARYPAAERIHEDRPLRVTAAVAA
jgi:anti-anti-sigma factor